MSDDTQLQAKTKQTTMTVAQRAEYAYQLGPKELAVFWLKLKGYDQFLKWEKEYHGSQYYYWLDNPNVPIDYMREEFLHFCETMAVKGYPKYKVRFLIGGWDLAINALGKEKMERSLTVQNEV